MPPENAPIPRCRPRGGACGRLLRAVVACFVCLRLFARGLSASAAAGEELPAISTPTQRQERGRVPPALAVDGRAAPSQFLPPSSPLPSDGLALRALSQQLSWQQVQIDELASTVARQRTANDRLQATVEHLTTRDAQHQAARGRLEATLDHLATQLQAADDSLAAAVEHGRAADARLRSDLAAVQKQVALARQLNDRHNYNGINADFAAPYPADGSDSARRTRRALAGAATTTTPTCSAPLDAGTPRLLVHGVCSCVEDVLIAGRSVAEDLRAINASVGNLFLHDGSAGSGSNSNSGGGSTDKDDACDAVAHWAPRVVGSAVGDTVNLNGARGVALSPDGAYAYVAAWTSDSLAVLDVGSDPGNPVVVGAVSDAVRLNGADDVVVAADGAVVYVALRDGDGVAVVNVTDPTNPSVLGSVVGDTARMDTAMHLARVPGRDHLVVVTGYASQSVAVVNVSDPARPTVVGSLADSTNFPSPGCVAVSSDGLLAFVAGYSSDTLAVVNITDAAAPALLGVVKDSANLNGAWGVAVAANDHHVFVASYSGSSLAAVDVSDPANPVLAGPALVDTSKMNGPHFVALAPPGQGGDVAFVSGYASNSVAAVDVSTPSSLSMLGAITGDSVNLLDALGVAVAPDGAFVVVAGEGSDSLAVVRFWKFFCAGGAV